MKRLWCVLAAVTVVYSGGCSSTSSKSPDEYVGECVFKPYNSDTDGFADFVILKRDLKAIEVRFKKKSGQVSTEEKAWYVSSPPGGQIQLVIDDFGHPVEKSGATIRLQNNYDLGMYYERIR